MAPERDRLESAVRGSVRSHPSEVEPFRRDASHLEGSPRAVVAPVDAEDVVALVRWARRNRVPLVPRGAGTSLDGESVPADGSVVVDLSAWNAVIEVEAHELWARVGPGLRNWDLQEALRPTGLFFPPNPGSWTTCTIAGNVGTNASGPRSFRYGPTRAWVRALEVVLGSGEASRFGSRVAKRSVGPDLLHLIVGSEGTLAIITEITLRLAHRPALREGLVFPLGDDVSLAAVARRLTREPGTGLSAVEFIDRGSAVALAQARQAEWTPDVPLLLLELEAERPSETTAKRARIVAALATVGVTSSPTIFGDADQLWMLRGASGVVLDGQMGIRVREDIAVPLGQIDALVRRLEEIGRSSGARLYLYGHLGEGSLHPNYVVDPGSALAERIRAEVLTAALELGGTVSSEHGIGRLKASFLARELGGPAVEILAAVKRACDPDGIMNPGKLYPTFGAGARRPPSP